MQDKKNIETPFQKSIVATTWISFIHDLQDRICKGLEDIDGKATFIEDKWERAEGGGGKTRVISNGNIFEKGGVNTSIVFGSVTETMRAQLQSSPLGNRGVKWFACGLSLVIHPNNPYVPTVHANWRYFELYDAEDNKIDSWFGGGTDLTPYYIFEEDGQYFHHTIKEAIDPFGTNLYQQYKQHCDEYFINRHRSNEARGIGGVFYDYLRPKDEADNERLLKFQQSNGNAFLKAYVPIVQKRKDIPFTQRELHWQEIRRGRYVEFNLIHDRGTIFGLKTNGRTESILMSLPARVRWEYNYQPQEGSEEAKLVEYLKPRNWIKEKEIDAEEWAKKANSC